MLFSLSSHYITNADNHGWGFIMNEKKNATSHNALMARINGNQSQSLDFINWIFKEIDIPNDATIVEFCCGTGKQTLEFVKRLTPGSRIHAFDIEQQSLDLIASQLNAPQKNQVELTCLDFNNAAKTEAALPKKIDLFFCSYGLYYHTNALKFLEMILPRLTSNGQLTIVGPYGKNNEELFTLLGECGVKIDDFVLYTSQRFMKEITAWMAYHFKYTVTETECNAITWDTKDQVTEYWKNSTFYEAALKEQVENRLNTHFTRNKTFVNNKYVMKVTAKNPFPKQSVIGNQNRTTVV